MNVIIAFDSALLRLFEKVAHACQKLTGKDNIWLGWACFWSRFCLLICDCFFGSLKNDRALLLAGLTVNIIIFMILQIMIKSIFGVSRMSFFSNSGTRNPLENNPLVRIARLLVIVIFLEDMTRYIFQATNLFIVGNGFLAMAMWYLFSCTPLPPGESMLAKLGKAIGAVLAPKQAAANA